MLRPAFGMSKVDLISLHMVKDSKCTFNRQQSYPFDYFKGIFYSY